MYARVYSYSDTSVRICAITISEGVFIFLDPTRPSSEVYQ